MFVGEHTATMDDKGRIAVPAKFRDALKRYYQRRAKERTKEDEDTGESEGDTLAVTLSMMDKCLTVYPPFEWERIRLALRALPTFDEQAYTIRHTLLGYAEDCGMDRSGRILVPQRLRKRAELHAERHEERVNVAMVGQDLKFEIWRQDLWEAQQDLLETGIEALKEDKTSLLGTLVL